MEASGIARWRGGVAAASRPPDTAGVLAVGPYTALVGGLATIVLGVTAATWDVADWRSLEIVALLLAFAVLAEIGSVALSGIHVSSSFLAVALAMALLGPGPAVLIGVTAALVDTILFRKTLAQLLTNLTAFATVALVGGSALEAMAGDAPHAGAGAGYAVAVFAVTLAAGATDFVIVCGLLKYRHGRCLSSDVRTVYLPTLPYTTVGAALAAGAALLHVSYGLPMTFGAVVVILVSELLLRAVGAARARAEQVVALTEQRAQLLEDALTAAEAERTWLATHLHDETLQLLAIAEQDLHEAAGGDAAAVPRAGEALSTAVAEIRHTLAHVHPASLDTLGLQQALTAYAQQLGRRGSTTFEVEVPAAVDPYRTDLLYSVGRELLANAAKHADAARVWLTLHQGPSEVVLRVVDDGRGFDAHAARAPGHVGLASVETRAAGAGGRFTVRSTPAGTAVEVALPSAL